MTKKYIVKAVILSFLLFSPFLSFSQGDFELLEANEFSINYPKSWEVDQSGQKGMSFAILSPLSLQGDQFRENVNLVIQDLSGFEMDLTDFVNLSENQIRTLITESEIYSSQQKEDYHEIVYSGKVGIYEFKFYQQVRIHDNKAFILTFTAEIGEYDNYFNLAKQLIDSFTIK